MISRPRRPQRQGRRSFGSILDRKGRKGFYIELRWKRRRVKRFAGLRRQDAEV